MHCSPKFAQRVVVLMPCRQTYPPSEGAATLANKGRAIADGHLDIFVSNAAISSCKRLR
jgi:hypothetical protein